MKRKPRIGLLPLYLKLYDETMPHCRRGFDPFMETVVQGLQAAGAELVRANICRTSAEVKAAVALFEKQAVDCVMTLHLAYSPSMEAAPLLARTSWPLIILDTTMDADFGRNADPSRLMYNHGVHGVMDLASMLRRLGRQFEIVAGHVTESDVLARAVALAQAAVAARRLRGARALRLGLPFKGMGDFAVQQEVLRRKFGIRIEQCGIAELAREMKAVCSAEVDAEMKSDSARYDVRIEPELHRRVTRAGLGLRRLLSRHDYTGFSVNFQVFATKNGPPMPFIEISKAMARGTGFGGEGDILTGCLVGALAAGFGGTTFTEIFCSDWRGNSLFLSHMGEINEELAAAQPLLVERYYEFLGSKTAAVVCAIKPGPATYVNVAPGPKNSFTLIVSPVNMLEDSTRDDMQNLVRGWMQPRQPVAAFLEEYSRRGGTHHSALVLGEYTEALTAFGRFAGLEPVVI